MYPILFSLGPIHFYSYGFFASLAFIAAFLIIYRLSARAEMGPSGLLEKLIIVLVSGLVVGHFSYFFLYQEQFSHWYEIFYLAKGLTSFGGILGGLLAIIIIFRRDLQRWMDITAIGFLTGVFFWRVGCFLTGDHPTISEPKWLTIFGSVPVPIFEAIFGLIGAAVLYLIYQKKILSPGMIALITIGYYGLIRLLVDTWRIDIMVGDWRIGQIIGVGLVILAVMGIIVLKIKNNHQ